MEDMTVQEVLAYAKLGEEAGKRYYENASAKVELQSAKKFLLELAKDEKRHIAMLTNLQKKIANGEQVPKITKAISNLNAKPSGLSHDLGNDADFVAIIKAAMEEEKKAIREYSNFADSLEEGGLRDLFILLANEEKAHLRRFEDEYDDFTDEMSHEKVRELITKNKG